MRNLSIKQNVLTPQKIANNSYSNKSIKKDKPMKQIY